MSVGHPTEKICVWHKVRVVYIESVYAPEAAQNSDKEPVFVFDLFTHPHKMNVGKRRCRLKYNSAALSQGNQRSTQVSMQV